MPTSSPLTREAARSTQGASRCGRREAVRSESHCTLLGVLGPHVGYANDQALAERFGCTCNRIERHRDVPWIEQAVQLRPARLKLFCHRLFSFLLVPHGLLELPCQDPCTGTHAHRQEQQDAGL